MGYLNIYSATQIASHLDTLAPGSTLSVLTDVSGVLAPLYNDPNLTIIRSNPLRADAEGRLPACYLLGGQYRLELRNDRNVLIAAQSGVLVNEDNENSAEMANRVFRNMQRLMADGNASTGEPLDPNDPKATPAKVFHVVEGDHLFGVAANDATDQDLTTPSGTRLYALPKSDNFISAEQVGAIEGFDPSSPSSNYARAAGNTVAIQAALDACRNRGLSGVRLRGRGYVVNQIEIHEGVTLEGATMNNEAYPNVKTARTVIYQPESFTSAPLVRMFDDTYTNNQWGATLRNLHLKRTGNAGTLLELRGGARAKVGDVDLVGGDLGMICDGTQDSHFVNIRRTNGVRGVELHNIGAAGQTDTTHFYNLWIESCTGRGLSIRGASSTGLANGIEIFGLKLEGRPTSANELLHLEDVLGVQIYGLVMPGGGSEVLDTGFAVARIAGRATGVTMNLLSGNNNYPAAIKALVALELDNSECHGIDIRMSGKCTGSGSVGALVDYGTAASGHVMPVQSGFDFSGLEQSGAVVGAPASHSGLTWQPGNTIRANTGGKVVTYGYCEHRGHPMTTNGASVRYAGPSGTPWFEMRADSTHFRMIGSSGGEVFSAQSNGKSYFGEMTFNNNPWKLAGGNCVRTAAQAAANSPNAASFPGGFILISNATPANRPAYSDGSKWRYVSDNVLV